ncbi:Uncharacterised protein [Burkholderia pseudomallei]|nr:Uncharacterised protein [Burkholderia pseudomallei]CAJ5908002.1 Uncharacterised protein [Burkholderia pseudomallei]CAJ6557011.1 Uncharacterised protein [Burkholderia pseudomallei]
MRARGRVGRAAGRTDAAAGERRRGGRRASRERRAAARGARHRGDRHGRALSAGGRSAAVLGQPARRPRLHRGDSAASLGLAQALRSGPRPRRPPQQVGRLHQRCRRIRSAVLQHLAEGSGVDGPEGAAVPRTGMDRDGGCRAAARGSAARRATRHGRLRRPDVRELSVARGRGRGRGQRRRDGGRQLREHREPRVVLPRPARPEPCRRHDVLELDGRRASRLPRSARGRDRRGDRGRRQSQPASEQVPDAERRALHVGRRALRELRQRRRGLRSRRGRRRAVAEAARRRRARRRPHPRPHQGERDQSRRPLERLHGAQRGRPGRRDRERDPGRRHRRARDQLRRGARHGNGARRSDRAGRPRARVRRQRRERAVPDRLGEIEHRPLRGRGGHRGADEGAAATGASPDRAVAPFARAESRSAARRLALDREPVAVRLGARRRRRRAAAAHGRRVRVRRGRDQRASDSVRIPGRRVRGAGGRHRAGGARCARHARHA